MVYAAYFDEDSRSDEAVGGKVTWSPVAGVPGITGICGKGGAGMKGLGKTPGAKELLVPGRNRKRLWRGIQAAGQLCTWAQMLKAL